MKTKHFIIAFFTLVLAVSNVNANNMLVQNVTTLNDNPSAKTVQVQFDLSWDNSWRDSINWDAAWIFLKFKDANGLWQHAKLNTNGFQNGSGTSNTVQVTSDNVGAWVYRDTRGSGTFNSTTMQLQWNYGLSGLSKVTGLEVRVFAVEMVYVPEGGFMTSSTFGAGYTGYTKPSSVTTKNAGYTVLNERLTPPTKVEIGGDTLTIRIKSNVGIDTDNNGLIDNTSYPTGYKAYYIYKYELTEQQYADFLNTLTQEQITTIGLAGNNISKTNNQFFTSTPNRSCISSIRTNFIAYSDWSGVRPMTFWELQKAQNGNQGLNCDNSVWTDGIEDVAKPYEINVSNFGVRELTGNALEPIISASDFNFTNTNGDGIIILDSSNKIVTDWNLSRICYLDFCRSHQEINAGKTKGIAGFRYVRSAE